MSQFVDHAQNILEAAESAGATSDLTILLGPQGIHMISDSDWPLDSLLREHGAESAYRVSGNRGTVRVEGREGTRRCVLESVDPVRLMLAARR